MARPRRAANLNAALDRASRRVLSHEDKLAAAASSVFRTAGRSAAKRFGERARASLTAAGEGGWEIPHADELVDVEAIVAALRTKSDPIRRSAIANYGRELTSIHPDLTWDVTNPLVGGVLSGSAQHVTDIADTTRINLMRIVGASYEEGLTVEDAAKAIREGMDAASQVRGRLIARTELAAVTNGGSLAATKILADATGDVYYKRWMTAPGARFPRHEDYEGLDGQTVGLDDAFDVGGGIQLRYPGDPDGPPEEICNCRCSLAYVTSPDEVIEAEPDAEPEMPAAAEGDAISLLPLGGQGDAAALARDVAANAATMDAYVTSAMQAAVQPLGGYLQGLAVRRKSAASIERKITTDIRRRFPSLPVDVASTGVKDGLRYTAVYRPGEYVQKMTATLDALREAGIAPTLVRPIWKAGSDYVGTNAIMRAPNGYRFELQFHTPQSFANKEYVLHDKYELWRKLDQTSPKALALSKQMAAESDKVLRPPGIEGWSYDTTVRADVGVTPFREGVDDPIGFYDSKKYERFERDARELADHFGVQIFERERATGIWEGAEEPSAHFRVQDGETGVRGFAAALGRAYRQDGVAIFEPALGDDVIARFGAVETPIPEAAGSSIREIATNMGAHELDVSPEFRPDLFKEPIKLMGGGFATPRNDLPAPRVKTRADKSTYGKPPRIEDTVPSVGIVDNVVPGSERPPKHLFRAISEEDYQQTLKKGYMKSDERMNLAAEGTVADFNDPSFYLPGKLASDADGVYPGRIVRIAYRDEDGWILDHDGYAKTQGKIPLTQIDLVSPKIETVRATDPRHGGPILDTRIVPASSKIDPDQAYAAMAKADLPAGRFLPDGTLEIIGSGPEFVRQLERLSGDLGVEYDGYLGKFKILEKANGDYEAAIGDAQSTSAGQARQAGRVTPGVAGKPALGEGAEGAKAGARPLALRPPPDVSPPAPPTKWTAPIPPSEAARFGTDRLWGAHAEIGKIENAARSELPHLRDDQIGSLLWEKGMGRGLKKGTLRFEDVAGDQQVHTFYSDGNATVQQVAWEARRRGESQIVISDHAHAMTTAEIADQHEQIDIFNKQFAGEGFKILKGIEANILADGTLDVAPEVLAQFDVVNAAIHAPIEGEGGQLALFKEANTARLLKAMDDPELNVLVHPHSVSADWDAVAEKAAQRGVALEVNGRDLLRNERQEAASEMIDAAKRHGAMLVIGSDAHATGDLVDLLYATRFAAQHGVTPEDLAPLARRVRLGGDPSASFPASFDTSSPGASRLRGGMNKVWSLKTDDGRHFVVKPQPDLEALHAKIVDMGGAPDEMLRENVPEGMDLERERATYVASRLFNEVGGDEFHVNVPPYRIGELKTGAETDRAGIYPYVEGEVGASLVRYGHDWADDVGDDDLRAAGLFDTLVGNTDRHSKNFIIGDELWLIDHGLAFPERPDEVYGELVGGNQDLARLAVERFGGELPPYELDFLLRLRERLPEIEPELRDLLGADAVEEMKVRLDLMIEEENRAPGLSPRYF